MISFSSYQADSQCTSYIYSWHTNKYSIKEGSLLLNEKLLIVGIRFYHRNATDINTVLTYAQYSIYKMYMLNYHDYSYTIWNLFKNVLLFDKRPDVKYSSNISLIMSCFVSWNVYMNN